MGLFTLEHSKAAYRADFALHGGAIVALVIVLVRGAPAAEAFEIAALIAAGLLAWSGLEYLLHRFVLHGLPPFRGWHAQHHRRPTALIYTPTVLTAALVAAGVFLPMWLAGGVWRACALTLGILVGYLSYSLTHHAVHHSRSTGAWLSQRRRWHARHHQSTEAPACYGVTTSLWDRLCNSTGGLRPRRAGLAPIDCTTGTRRIVTRT